MPDQIWASFATAGFTCWCPDPLTVRPAASGCASGPFPFESAATFVTADNPYGRVVTEDVNRARRAELAAFLDDEGLGWLRAIGGDPESAHLEPGAVVLGLDVCSARGLGARFEQAAVYLWTPVALHLVACARDRHDVLGYRSTPASRLEPPTVLRAEDFRPPT